MKRLINSLALAAIMITFAASPGPAYGQAVTKATALNSVGAGSSHPTADGSATRPAGPGDPFARAQAEADRKKLSDME